ncbi:MAG: MBL fold metallo-hydrolase [Bacilli bacterium]|jgi:flavorubredoxin|nr:FprA family A-type flavoprotein [Bacilli bacterium]NLN79845.1 FprA family A-type flavoprotein [Erysipelotrichia bacterium]
MLKTREILKDVYYVGASDHRLKLFENRHLITHGMAYNSYLVIDEKIALFDTADKSVRVPFLDNVNHVLQGRKIDYLILHHAEPDHADLIDEIMQMNPNLILVATKIAITYLKQFYDLDLEGKTIEVKEGDTLSLGKKTLKFFMAPMVHWPEVMVSYEMSEKILFSADAFGSFGGLEGNLFSDELDYEEKWVNETRRYYSNIVGKYGLQTLSLLNKLQNVEIKYLFSLHGPLHRTNISFLIDKYKKWATYTPEEKGVVIAYGSIYGNTEEVANILAGYLGDLGVKNISLYDTSITHVSYIIRDIFRFSHVALLSATYNLRVFPPMEALLNDITATGIKNRTFAIIENGSWSPTADTLIRAQLAKLQNTTILNSEKFTIKSRINEEQRPALYELAKKIAEGINS